MPPAKRPISRDLQKHITCVDPSENGCIALALLDCLANLLNLDPERVSKPAAIARILSLVGRAMGCADVQLLELVSFEGGSAQFIKHFLDPKHQTVRVTVDGGVNLYCVQERRFVVVEIADHLKRTATGFTGSALGEVTPESLSLKYVHVLPQDDEMSVLFFPLIRGENCIGTIKLCDFSRSGRFTIDDVHTMRPIAESVARILTTFTLIDDLTSRNQQLETALAEKEQALGKLSVGERLTYQYMTATSHLHELRGLLSGMQSDRAEFLALVERATLSRKQKTEFQEVIDRYARQRAEAHRKVLDLIGGRPASSLVIPKPHNLKQLIRDQLAIYENELRNEHITLRTALKDADMTYVVDESEFKYVIRILLNNAIHAVKSVPASKKRLVSILARRDNDCVELRVRDNGIGIPREYQSRVFDAFFTTKQDGSGVGLFWARKSVEETHKGILELEKSLPRKGTTFLIMLPINEEQ